MKNYLGLLAFILGVYFSFGQKVENKEFNVMLQNLLAHSIEEVIPSDINTNTDIIFLDAREKEEFKTSHIEGAKWIGFDNFKLKRMKNIAKDQKIVVYCSVGYRSEKIAEKLKKSGYQDVSNLYGGIFEWVHQGNDIYDESGKTKKVHTFNEEWSQWLYTGVKVY